MKLRPRSLAAPFVITAALSSGCYIVPEPAPGTQQQPATAGATPAGQPGTASTAPASGGAAPAAATAPAGGAGTAPVVATNPPPPKVEPATTGGTFTPTAQDRQVAEQAVALVEQMAKVAEAYPSDCDRAATELKVIVDKNRGVIDAANKLDNDEARRKWMEDTHGTRLMNAMGKIMPLMQKCGEHAGLKAVFESMSK